MNNTLWSYAAYLVVGIGITIWVARTLRRNGLVLLTNGRDEGAALAEAYSHLLVVGFYLVNFGAISFLLKTTQAINTPESAIEVASTKVGMVLVVLGIMHFAILASLATMRKNEDEDVRVRELAELRSRRDTDRT